MKISFPESRSDRLLAEIRGAPRILALVLVCFFVGVFGTYLLGNNLISLVVILVGVGGILIGAAVVPGLLRRDTADQPCGAPIKRKALRIKSEWDYRPRQRMRALAASGNAGKETMEFTNPKPFAMNNRLWFPEDSYINAGTYSSL